ncbi:hypothetical protein MUG87_19275 [Ectobacillus sp. JY-23]|uniref:hypothetical protein n=1 Tax=Ectobacillus sp. JY-23 TaxID=2933872 RepID=UPI001FF49428|nr:hypothetical protein [Ectobacillus sp. JY-23]UOY92524.1 hypothetical protein MUG87_19275 [Ectobacillus sp. JY-23]
MLIRFGYKSAFLFFTLVVGANLLFTPLLKMTGMSSQLSLFVVNSIASSAALTCVAWLIERKCENIQQASKWFGISLVVCTAASYYLIFIY